MIKEGIVQDVRFMGNALWLSQDTNKGDKIKEYDKENRPSRSVSTRIIL
jgi:hypothetical protein